MTKRWYNAKAWTTAENSSIEYLVSKGQGQVAYETIPEGQTKKTLVSNGVGNVSWQNLTIPIPDPNRGNVDLSSIASTLSSISTQVESTKWREMSNLSWNNTLYSIIANTVGREYTSYTYEFNFRFSYTNNVTPYLNAITPIKRIRMFQNINSTWVEKAVFQTNGAWEALQSGINNYYAVCASISIPTWKQEITDGAQVRFSFYNS